MGEVYGEEQMRYLIVLGLFLLGCSDKPVASCPDADNVAIKAFWKNYIKSHSDKCFDSRGFPRRSIYKVSPILQTGYKTSEPIVGVEIIVQMESYSNNKVKIWSQIDYVTISTSQELYALIDNFQEIDCKILEH